MKTIKFLLALIILVILFSTCSENDNVEPNPIPDPADSADLALTDEQAAFLETVKDTVIHLEDIILEDGQNARTFLETNDPDFLQEHPSGRISKTEASSPRLQKLKYLARMYGKANNLVDDALHTYPSAGADKPAQVGLVYSWGSKDHNIRQTPPGVGGECTDLKIYGLDCTGMIWTMTDAAKLNVEPKETFDVKHISDVDKWTKAFKASADYKDLKMKNMGMIQKNKMKNGDLILWGSHVGMYLYGSVYQSNGSKTKPGCNKNLEIGKGPRCISLSEILDWKRMGAYKVFRVIADYKFRVELKYSSFYALHSDVLLRDSANVKVVVKDEIVTCSDFTNGIGEIIPASVTEANGCTIKWFVGEYAGPFTITSGIGLTTEAEGGEPKLRLILKGTAHTPALTVHCPPNPALSTAVGYGPLFLPYLEFNLNDSIPTYKDPSGNLFAKAIPID